MCRVRIDCTLPSLLQRDDFIVDFGVYEVILFTESLTVPLSMEKKRSRIFLVIRLISRKLRSDSRAASERHVEKLVSLYPIIPDDRGCSIFVEGACGQVVPRALSISEGG